jgi:putative sigma-54 modulation protein
MRIDFTGRQMEVTSELRKYTEERLQPFARILHDGWHVHVILTAEKHRRTAEISLKIRDHILVGIAETPDVRTSICGALDKIKRQAVRLADRRRSRKRRVRSTAAVMLNVFGAGNTDHEERQVLEKERIAIKPLSVEEAVSAINSKRSGLVVFRNLETERINVLYRRDDGTLGLIEPEQ